MNSWEEIQQAILRLTPSGRAFIAEWLREFLIEEDRGVEEAAAVYGPLEELAPMTFDEYLAFEAGTPIRHEYVAGEIFAMSGASREHELVAGNVFNAFWSHLRGGPCQTFISNFKLSLRVNERNFCYYPDLMVACESIPDSRFCVNPRLLIEVLSPSTESIDRREKAANYRQIASLEEYALINPLTTAFTLHRRSEGWAPVSLRSLADVAEFRSIDLSLPLRQIYEGVLAS